MSYPSMTEEPSRGVKTQNPRDYTVQIRRAGAGVEGIVGTGVAVGPTRVITCAHVVKAATGAAPCAGSDAQLDVYYPQAVGSGAEKTRTARVDACFPAHDDDVVLLALEGSAPLGPEQFPTLGYAELSAGHKFRAYGYKQLGKYQAGHAYGTVMGCVECPPGFTLQAQ